LYSPTTGVRAVTAEERAWEEEAEAEDLSEEEEGATEAEETRVAPPH
jgi:hypothetical protein